MQDMKRKLSTLWVFVLFNYLYADVITLFDLVLLQDVTKGSAGPFEINQGFLLGAAVLMEIAIAMVVLSRVLPYRVNRWANMIAAAIETAAVTLSMFVGTPTPYYLFFGIIEIACTAYIVRSAWRWRIPPTR